VTYTGLAIRPPLASCPPTQGHAADWPVCQQYFRWQACDTQIAGSASAEHLARCIRGFLPVRGPECPRTHQTAAPIENACWYVAQFEDWCTMRRAPNPSGHVLAARPVQPQGHLGSDHPLARGNRMRSYPSWPLISGTLFGYPRRKSDESAQDRSRGRTDGSVGPGLLGPPVGLTQWVVCRESQNEHRSHRSNFWGESHV